MTDRFAARLATWFSGITFDSIPPEVILAAKDAVLDTVANSLLGAHRSGGRYAELATDGRDAVLIGRGRRSDVRSAAFVNALHAHSQELDDGFAGAGGHPGAVVVPAALAVGQRAGVDGPTLLRAVVAGYEVMHRVTAPVVDTYPLRGFQGTGIGGPFAGAAAAAVVLGLGPTAGAMSLAIAGSYACGITEYDQSGGESKRLYAAIGARGGVESALLAAAGMTGPPTVFEGEHGVWRAFGGEHTAAAGESDLGGEWRILRRREKRYPTVGTIHGAIDTLAEIVPRPVQAGAIDSIEVVVPPNTITHGGSVTVPHDMVSAQFSLSYSLAIRVLFGANALSLYEDPRTWADPGVIALCHKVRIVPCSPADPIAKGGALVTVTFADGRSVSRRQDRPYGHPDNPLPSHLRTAKLHDLLGDVVPAARLGLLTDAVDRLDRADSLTSLVRTLEIPVS